ncbi:TonB-dependent receptor [Chitinimonas naiadis]
MRLRPTPLNRAVLLALSSLALAPYVYADAATGTPAGASNEAATPVDAPAAGPEATPRTSKPGAKEEVSDLGAVVVTAQRREQKLKDVPLPITAVSGEAIRDKQIATSADIERLVPNLSGQSSGGRASKPRWFLRGIGTNDPNANQEGPLGVYVDEVVIGLQANQNFPIYDLDRVEVLRGPQRTLWGKNNTGGAIHYVSRKPQFGNEGYFKLGLGSYGSRNIEAAGNTQVVEDTVAVRGSVNYERGDGWARNIATNEDGPSLQDFAARFQVLSLLGDAGDILLSLRTRVRDGGNLPTYLIGATSTNNVATNNPNGAITQGGGSYIPPYGANPDSTSDFWAGEGYNKDTSNGGTVKINLAVGTNTLTSISAVDTGKAKTYSAVGTPAGSLLDRTSSRTNVNFRQVTQELRLTSPVNQPLSWIAGAYYYHQDADSFSNSARFAAGTTPEQYTESSWDQKSQSAAIFGNLKFNLDADNATTLGLRSTHEKKDIVETTLTATDTTANKGIVDFPIGNAWWQPGGTTGTGIVAPARLAKQNSWSKINWDITQEHRFNPDVLGFARVATGFRSGGFNQSIVNNDIIETNPETLTDYELGLKTSLWGGRVTANAALFYYDIKNLQLNIQQQVPGTTITSAAGSSNGNITGFELEVDAQLTDRLRLGNSLGVLHSEYTDFVYKVGPTTLDASGNTFYRTPKLSYRLDAEYRLPLNGGGALVFGSDWSYRSKIYHNATVQGDPIQQTPGYWNGNLRVAYLSAQKKLQVNAYVTNVTNQSNKVLSQIVTTRGVYPTSYAAPRQYGINLISRW